MATAAIISQTKVQGDGFVKYSDRPVLSYTPREWVMPLLFMLMMTLTGLSFYPALLGVLAIIFHQWRHDKYNCIIMLLIFFSGSALISTKMLPIKNDDMALVIAVILLFVYKKTLPIKKTVALLFFYALALLILATYSIESMSIQLITMRNYLAFLFFIIPIVVFGSEKFDIDIFFRKIIMFSMIMCAYYFIDAWVLGGDILAPYSYGWGSEASTFYHLNMHPLTFKLDRKMPNGLYFCLLAIYPISRCYRLQWWQWLIIILGFLASKTFSIISGCILAYIFFQGKLKTLIKYCIISVVAMVSLYFIDGLLPRIDKGVSYESTLRIKSSVDQVISLTKAVDDEDIATFASGRMAQIIPKVQLVYREGKQWTGLGFLHADLTKINRYIVHNEYYSDLSRADELAFGVENVPVQIFLTIGYIGLIVNALFFFILWLIVRKMKHSAFFVCTLFLCFWGGMAGFSNLINFLGLMPLALSYAVVILANGYGSINSQRFSATTK